MDENKMWTVLPVFVSSNPDNMPSVRLEEGNVEVIWRKMSNMEETLKEIINSQQITSDVVRVNM